MGSQMSIMKILATAMIIGGVWYYTRPTDPTKNPLADASAAISGHDQARIAVWKRNPHTNKVRAREVICNDVKSQAKTCRAANARSPNYEKLSACYESKMLDCYEYCEDDKYAWAFGTANNNGQRRDRLRKCKFDFCNNFVENKNINCART